MSSLRTLKILLALSLATSASRAEPFSWVFDSGARSLSGMLQQDEGDYSFHAVCASPTAVRLGIGAQQGVGKGDGGKVSVTLVSAAHVVRLDGRSGKSANFEMTAGVELQATVSVTHTVFQLLRDPGTITVSGDLKETWPASGRAAAVQSFLAHCR